MTTSTLTLTEFLLSRIAEDVEAEINERTFPGYEKTTEAQMIRFRGECHKFGWAVAAALPVWRRVTAARASRYADHPDYNPDWRP